VYRARDPRLNRDVAVKISSERFSGRSEREARAVASLNHPNICHLYDIGPDDFVMELIDGITPAGPMPLEEALAIARHLAAAQYSIFRFGVVSLEVLDFVRWRLAPDWIRYETRRSRDSDDASGRFRWAADCRSTFPSSLPRLS